jgi:hypothetical protein
MPIVIVIDVGALRTPSHGVQFISKNCAYLLHSVDSLRFCAVAACQAADGSRISLVVAGLAGGRLSMGNKGLQDD